MARRDSGGRPAASGGGRPATPAPALAARSLLLAAAGVVGTIFIAVGPRKAPDRSPPLVLVAELEADIAQAEREAQARALALARRERLGWIVATDEVTVGNLTPLELGLRAQPGERIQLAQVMLKGAGGVTRLLADPPNAEIPVALAAFGPQLFISDRSVFVAAVGAIVPNDRREELRGLVAVARPVDLTRTLQVVAQAGGGARLDVGGRALRLGTAKDAPGAPPRRSMEVMLRAPGAGAKLTLLLAPAALSWRRAITAAVLLFFTVFGAGVLWTLGRARAARE